MKTKMSGKVPLIKKEFIVDTEKGIVRNQYGEIEYYIEFNESENCILYRDIDGNIIDYFISGKRHTEDIDETETENPLEEKKLYDLYREWDYQNQIEFN